MLVLLSPAKTLDESSRVPTRKSSQPRMLPQAQELVDVLRRRSEEEIAELMHLSPELAAVNVQRFAEFAPPFTRRNARPALFMFAGDVYRGMAPAQFDERDLTEAQKSVRILSGLYGVLRPLDLIQPYRLEMGTALATPRGGSLYEWWDGLIADRLREDLAASPGQPVIVDCASREYSRAARLTTDLASVRVITPRFEDEAADGRYRVVSFFAKQARGAFAAWLVRGRVRTASAVTRFDAAGYRHVPEASTPDEPVFRRERRTPTA